MRTTSRSPSIGQHRHLMEEPVAEPCRKEHHHRASPPTTNASGSPTIMIITIMLPPSPSQPPSRRHRHLQRATLLRPAPKQHPSQLQLLIPHWRNRRDQNPRSRYEHRRPPSQIVAPSIFSTSKIIEGAKTGRAAPEATRFGTAAITTG